VACDPTGGGDAGLDASALDVAFEDVSLVDGDVASEDAAPDDGGLDDAGYDADLLPCACEPPPVCYEITSCIPPSSCTIGPVADGTVCPGGMCSVGTCVPAIPGVCGDGVRDLTPAREACDDGNEINTDACDNSCRKIIRQDGAQESIPNDNIVEANVLIFDVNSILRIRGTVGGQVDCYPHVYALNIPDQSRLRVAAIESLSGTETLCDTGTDAPFTITLQNRAGGQPISGGVDGNGCPILTTSNLDAGEYLVTLDASEDRPDASLYWMRFELLPPL